MMEKDEKDLKALFTPLTTWCVTSNSGWAAMEKNVKKQNFLTFGFEHFNVYYIIAASITLVCLGYSLSFPNTDNACRENETKIENVSNRETIVDAVDANTDQIPGVISENEEIIPKKKASDNEILSAPEIHLVMKKTPIQTDKALNINESDGVSEKTMNQDIAVDLMDEPEQAVVVENIKKNAETPQKMINTKTTFVVEETYDTVVKIDTQYVERKGLFRR